MKALALNFGFITITRITGILFLVLFLISKTYDLPTYVNTLLAIVWILLIPHFIGTLLLKIPIKYIKQLHFNVLNTGIAGIPIKWFIGLLLITVTSYISFIIQIGIINVLGPLLLVSYVAYNLSIRPVSFALHQKLVYRLDRDHFRIISILLIIGVFFAYYIRSFTPYPLSPGFDVFTHMFVINSILDNSFSNIPLTYFPAWDILLALGSTTFNVDLNSIFWMGPFLLSPLFSLSCYLMLFYFFKNKAVSILGTVICLPLTEQGLVPSMQVLYPSSVIMSIFPLMVFVVDFIWKKQYSFSFKMVFTFVIYSSLIIIHPMLGGIASIMLSLYILFVFYFSKKEKLFLLIRLLSIVFSLILLFYYYEVLTQQIYFEDIFKGKLFEIDYFNETIIKVVHLKEFYTEAVVTLGIFGFIIMSFHKNKKLVALNLIGAILLLAYFQQLIYVHRILALERPLLIFAATFAITLPLLLISSKLRSSTFFGGKVNESLRTELLKDQVNSINSLQKLLINKVKLFTLTNKLGIIPSYEKSNKLLIIYVVIVYIIMFPILIYPFDFYVGVYLENGQSFASYTPEVISAANWINENIPNDFKIYSDPQTVLEIRGLANRPNIEAIGWNTTVAQEVKSVLQSDDPQDAYERIMANHGHNVLIVITPKTSEWIHSSLYFITLPITDFKNFSGLNKFYNDNYFNLDYNKNDIFIFTLR